MLVGRAERAERGRAPGLGWPAVPGAAVAARPWWPEVPSVPKAQGVQHTRDRGSLATWGSGLIGPCSK